eukprot:Skav200066  [mRNA]  locus=scaffold838:90629:92586:- [translate_table: standard]
MSITEAFGVAFEGRQHQLPVPAQRFVRALQRAGVELRRVQNEGPLRPQRGLHMGQRARARLDGSKDNLWVSTKLW